jgi:glycosyltransferase involved in cell wall biosynthesis
MQPENSSSTTKHIAAIGDEVAVKTLMLVTSGLGRFDGQIAEKADADDNSPRASLFPQTLNADSLGEDFLVGVPSRLRFFYGLLPRVVAQVIEAYRTRRGYDAIISWSERRALFLALILKVTRSRMPHVALMYWLSKPKQALFIRVVHTHIDKIITWSSFQRDHAMNVLGIPADRIQYLPYGVDQQFWRPMAVQPEMICSVGEEMRDYKTLIDAVKDLRIHCHIVAGTIRVVGRVHSQQFPMSDLGPFPPNVTVGTASYAQLRSIYARSFFVVVPILPTDTSSGLTVILEAMAMGKAVITSRTPAQVDVVVEGKTGIFVPVGDAPALRDAIQHLLAHPDVAEAMGREGRKRVEQNHTLEGFVDGVRLSVERTVLSRKRPAGSKSR